MDAKQFEADIQYLGSFLTECSFDNNIIDAVSQCELTHQLSVSISEQVPIDDPSKKAAYVRLILDGVYSLQDGSEASCKYHMVIHGKFMIDKSVPDEDFETKLWFNGSAAVYGIAVQKWRLCPLWFLIMEKSSFQWSICTNCSKLSLKKKTKVNPRSMFILRE